MKVSHIVVFCIAAAILGTSRLTEAGPGSAELASQHGSCGGMVQKPAPPTAGPTPSNPPNVTFNCPLVDSLQAICDNPEVGLSASDQEVLQELIINIQITLSELSVNVSVTIDEIVVAVAMQIQSCLQGDATLSAAISMLNLEDASGDTFGFVQDFISVSIEIQVENVGPSGCLTLNSNNDCPVMDAIEAAGLASGSPSIESECEQLSVTIQEMLQQPGNNETQQLALIYQIVLQQYPELLPFLMSCQVNIAGFGSIQSLMSVCQVQYQTVQMSIYLAGSTSTCPFLLDLEALVNSCQCSQCTNQTECVQLNNMYQILVEDFSSSTDILVRLEDCATEIAQFCALVPGLCTEELASFGISLYELELCSNLCHNEGTCECVEVPPPTCGCGAETGATESAEASSPAPAGSTAPPSAESSAAPAGSSAAPAGSSPAPAGSSAAPAASSAAPAASSAAPAASSPAPAASSAAPPASSPAPAASSAAPAASSAAPAASSPAPAASSPAPAASSPAPAASSPAPAASSPAPAASSPAPAASSAAPAASSAAPAGSTAAPAGSAPPATGTAASVTPTASGPNCAARTGCVTLQTSCNCYLIVVSINVTFENWTPQQRTSFSPDFAQILQVVESNNSTYPTPASKVDKIISIIAAWASLLGPTNSLVVQMYATVISGFGTLHDFMNCGTM